MRSSRRYRLLAHIPGSCLASAVFIYAHLSLARMVHLWSITTACPPNHRGRWRRSQKTGSAARSIFGTRIPAISLTGTV